jgi:hypothetical protein
MAETAEEAAAAQLREEVVRERDVAEAAGVGVAVRRNEHGTYGVIITS